MITKKYFGIIYKTTNKINGKIYIGQTIKNLEQRKREHLNEAKRDSKEFYFYRAIRKHDSENFDWEILEQCNSKEELDLAEEWYIRYYKTFTGFADCCGYNLTLGGGGIVGFRPSTETRKKMSKAQSGENNPMYGRNHTNEAIQKIKTTKMRKGLSKKIRQKISETKKELYKNPENTPMFGKTHTEETIQKMSEAKKGKNHPMFGKKRPEHSKKMSGENNPRARAVMIKGQYFSTITEAARVLNVGRKVIHYRLKKGFEGYAYVG